MNTTTYYRIKPEREDHKGLRWFAFNPLYEKVLQIVEKSSARERGRTNLQGVYTIHRTTFTTNYFLYYTKPNRIDYVEECTQDEFLDAMVRTITSFDIVKPTRREFNDLKTAYSMSKMDYVLVPLTDAKEMMRCVWFKAEAVLVESEHVKEELGEVGYLIPTPRHDEFFFDLDNINVKNLRHAFVASDVTSATIKINDTTFKYINISDNEYQFGVDGNILTNYND